MTKGNKICFRKEVEDAVFIKQVPRTVWDVFVVEAESAEAVEGLDYDEAKEELLGAYSELGEGDCQICGPFASKTEALGSPKAWVE